MSHERESTKPVSGKVALPFSVLGTAYTWRVIVVSILSFSKEKVDLSYGEAKVGDLSIKVSSSGIASANANHYPWPGKPGNLTVSDNGVFGYFVSMSPGDYIGLLEVDKDLVLFSRVVAPFSDSAFGLPPGWRVAYHSYLPVLKSNTRVSDLSFRILDLNRVLVGGSLDNTPFGLLVNALGGTVFRNGNSKWIPVSPGELALLTAP